MVDDDPFDTQRLDVESELQGEGFAEAREIGRGGFGAVYRCHDTKLDRIVAVKVLTSSLDAQEQSRFLREQQAMARLTGHPNIVTVLHVDATRSGRPYLVMPYHSRGSIANLLRLRGTLTVEETLRLGVRIVGALETAHRAGIIHCDVKPGNILLTDYGEPALADFGIAHFAGGVETTAGTVFGSPAFTAPEVLSGASSSPGSDIYGLGATLFAALTGHAAFERRSGEQVVAQFLRITEGPQPQFGDAGWDRELSLALELAMSRDPKERPSAVLFGNSLQQLQSRYGLAVDEMALMLEPHVNSVVVPPAKPRSAAASRGLFHASASNGALPQQLNNFVGRRFELTEIKRLLAKSRLVTLTGAGGIGKTRLALRAGKRVRREFSDGIRLVELGELQDDRLLTAEIAVALGLRPYRQNMFDLVTDQLQASHLLLILDNCEQIVDATAKAAESLLRTCPNLRILATSRESLGIDGETILRVSPLTYPKSEWEPSTEGALQYEAIALFLDRAVAALPEFSLTEENVAAVAGICSVLDGLPLPIELAAAQLRAMSPDQILHRLTNRYPLLARRRGAPYRQQTMQSCIDWSFELCTLIEQQIWAELSVFVGTFDLEDAEQICRFDKVPNALVDVLGALVDKSVLVREETGTTVYFRLFQALRDYGRHKLELTGDYSSLQRRHRDRYRELVLAADADWISSRQLEWVDRLDREQANIREAIEVSLTENALDTDSALSFVSAMQPYWLSRGQLTEGRRWLNRALGSKGPPSAARAKAIFRNCALAEVQGDLQAANVLIAEARELSKQTEDADAQKFVDCTECLHELYRSDPPSETGDLDIRLENLEGKIDVYTKMTIFLTLGWLNGRRGDSERALHFHEEALKISEARGDSVNRSYALWATAVSAWRRGGIPRANNLLLRALHMTAQQKDPVMACAVLEALAWVTSTDARRSAILMGAANTLGRSTGIPTVAVPHLLVYHDECEQLARRALGDRGFDIAYHTGASWSLSDAVNYALQRQPKVKNSTRANSAQLTKREQEVATLVAEGMTNKSIAASLVISPRTAQGHVEHILNKLGFTSRSQIAAWVSDQRRHDQNST